MCSLSRNSHVALNWLLTVRLLWSIYVLINISPARLKKHGRLSGRSAIVENDYVLFTSACELEVIRIFFRFISIRCRVYILPLPVSFVSACRSRLTPEESFYDVQFLSATTKLFMAVFTADGPGNFHHKFCYEPGYFSTQNKLASANMPFSTTS